MQGILRIVTVVKLFKKGDGSRFETMGSNRTVITDPTDKMIEMVNKNHTDIIPHIIMGKEYSRYNIETRFHFNNREDGKITELNVENTGEEFNMDRYIPVAESNASAFKSAL